MSQPVPIPILLDSKDVAALLNVSESWVRKHCTEDADPRLPFIKLGRGEKSAVRFHPEDVQDFIERHRPRPALPGSYGKEIYAKEKRPYRLDSAA